MHAPEDPKESAAQRITKPGLSPSLFERALDSLPDGVLLTDARRRVVYVNQAFAKQWKIPADLIESRDETRMLHFVADQLVDANTFIREVDRLHPTSQTSHDEIRFK